MSLSHNLALSGKEYDLVLGPVSRILFRAERRGGRHFSQPPRSRRLSPPGPDGGPCEPRRDAAYPRLWDGPSSRLFCLAPDGVFRAVRLAADAVGSYPTFSPLPDEPPCGGTKGGLFSVTLSVAAP